MDTTNQAGEAPVYSTTDPQLNADIQSIVEHMRQYPAQNLADLTSDVEELG